MSQHDAQPGTEPALRTYFRELDAALSGLPRAKRKQLAAEIRGHVDAALAEQPPRSPADLRNLLDRVGQPEDIAAAALAEEPDRTRPPLRTWQRVLLVGGAVVLVGAGTGVGLALSSGSPAGSPAAVGTPTPTRAATSAGATTAHPAKATLTPPGTPTPTAPASTAPASTAPASTAPASTGPPPVGASSPPASSTVPASGGSPAVLAPATVPPVSTGCSEQVTYAADGNVTPVTCANGGVNAIAWHAYAYSGAALNGSELLRLGSYASPAQVYQAMCHDDADVYKTNPVTESAEEIAQAYYGWRFAGDNPLQDFERLGCPATT